MIGTQSSFLEGTENADWVKEPFAQDVGFVISQPAGSRDRKGLPERSKKLFSTVRPFQKRLACNRSPIPPLHKSSPHTLSLIHPHDHHQTYIHSPIHPFQHPSAHRQSPTPPHPRSLTAANHSMLRKAQPSIGRSRANLGLARSPWRIGLRMQKILL